LSLPWLLLLGAGLIALSGCAAPPGRLAAASPTATPRPAAAPAAAPLTPAPSLPGDPERGRLLMETRGCTGCHTVGGVAGARGVAGPVLTNVVLRPTLAGRIPTSPENLTAFLLDPAALKPDTTMPKLGLSPEEARDLVAYLYSQPFNPGR
jgi:cytochrome c2